MVDSPGRGQRAERCVLVREDGTSWTVESLELTRERFLVTGRLRDGDADSDRLVSEPLDSEDELRWIDGDGEVVARLRGAEP